MRNIDLTYIIPMILSLLSFVVVLFWGKWKKQNNTEIRILKIIPLLSVIGLIIGVFSVTYYYENQIVIEKAKFSNLQKLSFLSDSVLISNKSKRQAIDSLVLLENQLNNLLEKIKKQEKITGQNTEIKNEINEKISKTKTDIGKIESYNQIIDEKIFSKKGYMSSGNTSSFQFACPTDKSSEFIDLSIIFNDNTLIEKIAYIYIDISEKKSEKEFDNLFSQAYKPRIGKNAFKIKNYLIKKGTVLNIGYFLKTEMDKEYPRFEKISCWSE